MAQIRPLTPSPPFQTIPELSFFYIEDFKPAAGENGRQQLRKMTKQLLEEHNFIVEPHFLDLELLPQHHDVNVSLSHCADASLIGWVKKPVKIGVDVEEQKRISGRIIERVSDSSETALAPFNWLLWSAKEATFKAHSDTVNVISNVEIFDWFSVQENLWSFKARLKGATGQPLGNGEIRLIQGHSVAFFVSNH